MIVKLLTEHHLQCLSLKGGYRGSLESTHFKMPHCLKSHALAHTMNKQNPVFSLGKPNNRYHPIDEVW